MADQTASRQRHGQYLYKEKDYRAALTIFDNLVKELHDPPVDLLDNRAAVHSRLKDFPKALRDGKRMIHLDKQNPAGYLRTGQILRLMGNENTALDIYKYGLKHLDPTSEGARMLIGMRDKLLSKQANPNHTDPLLVLPLELIEQVVGYLGFMGMIPLLRVSKSWNSLITGSPSLWKIIEISELRRNITIKAFKPLVLRGRRETTRVVITRYNFLSADVLKFVVGQCPKLDSLVLNTGLASHSLTTMLPMARRLTALNLFGKSIPQDTVSQILERCTSLATAKFMVKRVLYPSAVSWNGDLSKLKHLRLGSTMPDLNARDLNLKSLVRLTPQLEHLELFNFHSSPIAEIGSDLLNMKDLRVLECTTIARFGSDAPHDFHFEWLPASLEHLNLGSLVMTGHMGEHRQLEQHPLPDLKTFELEQLQDRESPVFSNLLSTYMPNIEKLHCASMIGYGPANAHTSRRSDFEKLIDEGHLKHLRSLSLKQNVLRDETLSALAAHCLELTDLTLSEHPYVTGAGLKSLILTKGTKLQTLNLERCDNVGEDAINWARAQGVEVVRKHDGSRPVSGRRVFL